MMASAEKSGVFWSPDLEKMSEIEFGSPDLEFEVGSTPYGEAENIKDSTPKLSKIFYKYYKDTYALVGI